MDLFSFIVEATCTGSVKFGVQQVLARILHLHYIEKERKRQKKRKEKDFCPEDHATHRNLFYETRY